MKILTLSILCAGLITTTAIAEDICNGAYQAQNYKEAAQCYVQQLKKEKSFDNYYLAGRSYNRQGRYKEALPYLKEAETKAKTSNDHEILYSSMGLAYGNLGDTKQDLAYSMKFLNLSLQAGNRSNIGSAYSNLGVYYNGQNQRQNILT